MLVMLGLISLISRIICINGEFGNVLIHIIDEFFSTFCNSLETLTNESCAQVISLFAGITLLTSFVLKLNGNKVANFVT